MTHYCQKRATFVCLVTNVFPSKNFEFGNFKIYEFSSSDFWYFQLMLSQTNKNPPEDIWKRTLIQAHTMRMSVATAFFVLQAFSTVGISYNCAVSTIKFHPQKGKVLLNKIENYLQEISNKQTSSKHFCLIKIISNKNVFSKVGKYPLHIFYTLDKLFMNHCHIYEV